jgi:hypothetical protein
MINQNLKLKSEKRIVAKLWAQSKSETDITRELYWNVSTLGRDIKY